MLLLMALYGLILAFGAKLISDGSEELLELFPKFGTVIGALLLPVLGAVPDAAIVVASGAVGTVAEAQEQLSVGVGTLAGSTIMLLTIPWCASMWLARCDFVRNTIISV
jgi:Ca2+/Na+ antiporter